MSTTPQTVHQSKRVLVIANETCPSPRLCAEVKERAGEGGEVFVVAPALNTRLRHFVSDEDAARHAAEERLSRSVENLAGLGLSPHGDVGDADPVLAIQDALATFRADEIVLATHPPERSNWLERDVVETAKARFGLPVTHIVIDEEAGEGNDER